MQYLERSVETLAHPGQREYKDQVRSEESDKACEMHRLRELLRDRGRTERQRLRDGGERSSLRQLVQQAQSPELEHRPSASIDPVERYSSPIIAFVNHTDGAP